MSLATILLALKTCSERSVLNHRFLFLFFRSKTCSMSIERKMSVCESKIFQLQCYSTKWFAVNEQSKLKILFNLPCEKWFQVCKISGFISSIFVFYKVIRICGSVVKFRGCFVVDMGLYFFFIRK